jgi:hypothetical protein
LTAAVQAVTSGVVTLTVFTVPPTTPGTSSRADVPSSKIEAPLAAMKRTISGEPAGPKFVPAIVMAVGIAPAIGACAPTMVGAAKVRNPVAVWTHDEPKGEITRIADVRDAMPQTAASGVVSVSVWAGPTPPMRAGIEIVCWVPSPKSGKLLSAMKRTVACVPAGPKFVPLITQPFCWTAAGTGLSETVVTVGAAKFTKPAGVGSVQQPSGKKTWTLAPSWATSQTVAIGVMPVIVLASTTVPTTSAKFFVPSFQRRAPLSPVKRTVAGPPTGPKPVPVTVKGVGRAAGIGFGVIDAMVGALITTVKTPVDVAKTPPRASRRSRTSPRRRRR